MNPPLKGLAKPCTETPLTRLNHVPRIVTRHNYAFRTPSYFDLEAQRKAQHAAEQAKHPQKWY